MVKAVKKVVADRSGAMAAFQQVRGHSGGLEEAGPGRQVCVGGCRAEQPTSTAVRRRGWMWTRGAPSWPSCGGRPASGRRRWVREGVLLVCSALQLLGLCVQQMGAKCSLGLCSRPWSCLTNSRYAGLQVAEAERELNEAQRKADAAKQTYEVRCAALLCPGALARALLGSPASSCRACVTSR